MSFATRDASHQRRPAEQRPAIREQVSMNKHYVMGCIPPSQPASQHRHQNSRGARPRLCACGAKTDSELSIQLAILQHGVSWWLPRIIHAEARLG